MEEGKNLEPDAGVFCIKAEGYPCRWVLQSHNAQHGCCIRYCEEGRMEPPGSSEGHKDEEAIVVSALGSQDLVEGITVRGDTKRAGRVGWCREGKGTSSPVAFWLGSQGKGICASEGCCR